MMNDKSNFFIPERGLYGDFWGHHSQIWSLSVKMCYLEFNMGIKYGKWVLLISKIKYSGVLEVINYEFVSDFRNVQSKLQNGGFIMADDKSVFL